MDLTAIFVHMCIDWDLGAFFGRLLDFSDGIIGCGRWWCARFACWLVTASFVIVCLCRRLGGFSFIKYGPFPFATCLCCFALVL